MSGMDYRARFDDAAAVMAAARLAKALRFMAAPVFALMALLTLTGATPPLAALCAQAHEGAVGGMAVMYLLMSAFHAPPWLALIAGNAAGDR